MAVLLVPLCLLAVVGLLWFAERLERRTPELFIRFALRSKATDEVTEKAVAAELAPLLRVNGLDTPAPEAVKAPASA